MVTYQLYVPKDKLPILEKLKEIAKREGKPISAIIFTLIEDYLKKHGEGNPSFRLDKWVEQPNFKAFPTLGEIPNYDKLMKEDPQYLMELKDKVDRWSWLLWRVCRQKGLVV
jgi:hypothetical protein